MGKRDKQRGIDSTEIHWTPWGVAFEDSIRLLKYRGSHMHLSDGSPTLVRESYLVFDTPMPSFAFPAEDISAADTKRVKLAGALCAHVSTLTTKIASGALLDQYTVAVAALCCLAIGRAVEGAALSTAADPDAAAMTMPTVWAGTARVPPLPDVAVSARAALRPTLLGQLLRLDYETYFRMMRVIRLYHLGMLNMRRDIGLAYALFIASVEALVKVDILRGGGKRGKVKVGLGKLIAQLVLELVPQCDWDSGKEIVIASPDSTPGNVKTPADFKPEGLSDMLKATYNDRCGFFHEGVQPDQREPSGFFEPRQVGAGLEANVEWLPTVWFMLELARLAILRYIDRLSSDP